MYDIQPWHGWRDDYRAEKDEYSPFYKRKYDEFNLKSKIYNYFIHQQWDFFGSDTLYVKILYVGYEKKYAIIELLWEWNDGIGNDIMWLKRELIDQMVDKHINKFVLICDNVLNFHGDDDSYYEEWYDDIKEEGGWICLINTFDHVNDEMNKYRLYYYLNFGPQWNDFDWRRKKPSQILKSIETQMANQQKHLT